MPRAVGPKGETSKGYDDYIDDLLSSLGYEDRPNSTIDFLKMWLTTSPAMSADPTYADKVVHMLSAAARGRSTALEGAWGALTPKQIEDILGKMQTDSGDDSENNLYENLLDLMGWGDNDAGPGWGVDAFLNRPRR
jgi:hypothetical protein